MYTNTRNIIRINNRQPTKSKSILSIEGISYRNERFIHKLRYYVNEDKDKMQQIRTYFIHLKLN